MMSALTPASSATGSVWSEGGVALGHAAFKASSFGGGSGMNTAPAVGVARHAAYDGRYVLVADARIDNRAEVARALRARGRETDDASLLLHAFARWGRACVDRLIGVFAFAVWDMREHVLFCARDPVGVRPFYYAFQPGRLFACSSALGPLLALDEVPRTVNETRVADFLARRGDDTAATFYDGILRLPPGHTLTLGKGAPLLERYWEFGGREAPRAASDAAFEEGFRAVFAEAVRCRLPDGPVGVLLSGGLDSSSVAGVAARHRGDGLHGFSATFPDLPDPLLGLSDERAYVAAVAEATGLMSHLVPVSGTDPAEDLALFVRGLHQPPFISNLYLIHRLHEAARSERVTVLLDGCEGDDAVSHGLERFWELGYQGRWADFRAEAEALASRLGGTAAGVFAARGRRGAVARARTRPFRFLAESPAIAAISGESVLAVLTSYGVKPFLKTRVQKWRGDRVDVPALLHPDLVRRVDFESRLAAFSEQGRSKVMTAQELHRLVLTAGGGAIATVLEETSHLASLAGVERRHPFYDVRLLDYCLALPVEQKLKDGWTRSILRRALRDVLPDLVRHRVDKADLSPHFSRSVLADGRRIDRLFREDWPYLEPFVRQDELRAASARGDSATLWSALALATWLRMMGDAPEVRAG